MSVELSLIRDVEALRALEPEWRALAQAGGSGALFRGPDWLMPWWLHYHGALGAQLYVVIGRAEGKLVALAPLYTRTVKMAVIDGHYENNMFLVSSSGTFVEDHHGYFDRSLEGCGWAWDADFFDFGNDGEEDLYIVNGREPNLSYDQERNVLYKQRDGHFYDVSRGSGTDFRGNSRGAAFADFDLDGDLDIICNNYQSGAVLLRNNLQRNNWIRLWLRGTP